MRSMGRLTRFFGWSLIVMACLIIAVEIDDAASGKSTNRAVGVVMVIGFAWGGWRLLNKGKRAIEATSTSGMSARQIEDAVLSSARKNNGRVTVTDVAADTSLTFTEAKQALEHLAKAGACETLLTDNGLLVYNFVEIIHAHRKADAT